MVDSADPKPAEGSGEVVSRRKGPRRRGRPILVAVFAGMLWLIGQGVGWLGSGPSGEGGDLSDVDRGASSSEVAAVLPIDVGRVSDIPGANDHSSKLPKGVDLGGNMAGAEVRVVAGNVEETPVPGLSPAKSLTPGISIDRYSSWIALLENYLIEADLGNASAALQRLLSQPLSSEQRERAAVLEAQLLPLLRACESRILAHVQNGEVLAANTVAAQLVVADVWRPGELLRSAASCMTAENWQSEVVVDEASELSLVTLISGRKVRVFWRDQIRLGVVATRKPSQLTVKLRGTNSQAFPTVKFVACEPVDSTAAEAVEMGFVALHAGAPRLARLWLLRAVLLTAELAPRGQILRDLLQ